jgi:hypothetical protein
MTTVSPQGESAFDPASMQTDGYTIQSVSGEEIMGVADSGGDNVRLAYAMSYDPTPGEPQT